MSDIKLFRYGSSAAQELAGGPALVEKTLQNLVESQMHVLLGIIFLASEYVTGKTHGGRIDTLGIDENGCPVIIEYKRHTNENVINQGLYYLDWLLDHKAEFQLLVMNKLGKAKSDAIEWQGTRLLCIASDFTKFDSHAVAQINRSIELIRYKLFEKDLLLLELANVVSVPIQPATTGKKNGSNKGDKTFAEQLDLASPELRDFLDQVASYLHSLGDDIQEKQLKLYTAYRRLRNFVCVIIVPKQDPRILLTLRLNPQSVNFNAYPSTLVRDVHNIGHWGTGDVEVSLRKPTDLEMVKELIERSYMEN